jgi:hypothetical protein
MMLQSSLAPVQGVGGQVTRPMRSRLFKRLGLFLLVLYLDGYVVFRVEHQMVHHLAVAAAAVSAHRVEAGDAWFIGAAINGSIALAYTPLRYLETAFWYLWQPPGASMPR